MSQPGGKLVDCAPIIINTPHLIAPLLNYDHPGAVLVIYMAQRWSVNRINRAELRRVVKLDGKEPRFAASFEWLLLRINDTLPLTGWVIDEERERYRLEPISQRHHERLVRRYSRLQGRG